MAIEECLYNKKFFKDYVRKYNSKIPQVKRKIIHGYRVAELCQKLCEDNRGKKSLAYAIGLLHDFYRMEQFEKYRTFSDNDSVDHGDMACKLLFQDNLIKNFKINKKDYAIVYFAIKNHNKISINQAEIDKFLKGEAVRLYGSKVKLQNSCSKEEIIYYSKLIRDADKIDIMNYLMRKIKDDLNDLKDGVTRSVYKSFKNMQSPKISQQKTKLDYILIKLSFIYDINFEQTFKFFNVKKFIALLTKQYYKKLNTADQQKFQQILVEYKNNLQKKINLFKK